MESAVPHIRGLSQTAKQIGVERSTARRYAEEGHFPNAYRLPGGAWRIPQSDIDAFKTKCRPSSGTPRLTTEATNIVTA